MVSPSSCLRPSDLPKRKGIMDRSAPESMYMGISTPKPSFSKITSATGRRILPKLLFSSLNSFLIIKSSSSHQEPLPQRVSHLDNLASPAQVYFQSLPLWRLPHHLQLPHTCSQDPFCRV